MNRPIPFLLFTAFFTTFVICSVSTAADQLLALGTDYRKLEHSLHKKTGYPKWDGLIDLSAAGLSVPSGVFIAPCSEREEIGKQVTSFLEGCKSHLIALRPDGQKGIGASPAGITFKRSEQDKIVEQLAEWSSKEYGITILETHNRFDYDFCCNILFSEDGSFTMEFVGPGFDGGDLNKSLLKPMLTVRSRPESPISIYSDQNSLEPNIETLQRLPFRITIDGRSPNQEDIEKRLKYIADKLLPDMGVKTEKTPSAARKWLEINRCSRLLKKEDLRNSLTIDDLRKLTCSASLYAHSLLKKGANLKAKALTAHKYNNKIVFFGAYDGFKWGKFEQNQK